MKTLILCLLALPLCLISCNGGSTGNDGLSPAEGNIYRDVNLQKIYNYRFDGSCADLIKYISSDLPEYRKAAAYAIGAMRDSMGVMSVMSLLDDPDADVRLAAVSALGQIGHRAAAMRLRGVIESDNGDDVKKAAIVALGKCGADNDLNYICAFDYIHTRPQLAAAQAESMCMFLKRGIRLPAAVDKAVAILVDKKADEHLRGIAAQYLAECGADLAPYTDQLISAYKNVHLVWVQMYIARALRFSVTERSQYLLQRIITQDTCDYRVKISAIQSCNSFKYKDFKDEMLELANHPDDRIASSAACFILNKGVKADSTLYVNAVNNIPGWKSRAVMRAAVLKFSNNKQPFAQNIVSGIEASQNVFEKIALMDALSTNIDSYNYIMFEAFNSENSLLRAAGLRTLINMFKLPEFDAVSRAKSRSEGTNLYKEFALIFKNAVQKGTPEMAAMAARVIADNADQLAIYYGNTYFFNQALRNCRIPEDGQAYRQIAEANKVVNGQDTPYNSQQASLTPDWKYIVSIKPDQKVRLTTTKGKITLQLKVNSSPVAVQYFMRLVEGGYFSNTLLSHLTAASVTDNGSFSEFEQTKEIMIPCEPDYDAMTEGSVALTGDAEGNVFSNKFTVWLAPAVGYGCQSSVFASVVDGLDNLHNIQDGDMVISAEKI